MDFKAVEMQIAIPRTGEAAHWQNQLSQKPLHDQSALAAQFAVQEELQRKRSNKAEEAVRPNIRDDQGKGKRRGKFAAPEPDSVKKRTPARSEHPFKGRHIDLSL
jgi:hypothetical protein